MLGNTSSITTTNNVIHAHVCCVFCLGEYEEPLVLDRHPSQTVINKLAKLIGKPVGYRLPNFSD